MVSRRVGGFMDGIALSSLRFRRGAEFRSTRAVAIAFAVLLTIQIAGLFAFGTGRTGRGISESILLIDNLLALACVWISFRRAQGVPALFWSLFAIVMWVLLIPTAFQTHDTLFDSISLSDSTWRLLYCLYGAPILMMLFLPEADQRTRLKSESFLDLFQVAVVVGLIYATFFFLPAQRMLAAEAQLRNISISDKQSLILLAAAFVRLQFARVAASRSLLVRLTIFLLVCAVATFIGDWLDLNHHTSGSVWFGVGWAIPHLTAAFIAITWIPSVDAEPSGERANFFSFLGTNLVLVTMLAIVFLMVNRWEQAYGEVLTDVAIGASLLAFTFRLAFTQFHQQQEIAERKAAQGEASASHRQVGLLLDDARRQTREMTQISQIGSLLQVCISREEVFRLIPERLRQLFPGASGSISLFNPSRIRVEPVAGWGIHSSDPVFVPQECWALRSGRIHTHDGRSSEPRCSHLRGEGASVCIPLVANTDSIGVLAIQVDDPLSPTDEGTVTREGFTRLCQLAAAVAEQVTLTLANLNLRETLRLQASRDELTGLYNRRYLEEFMDRALRAALRKQSPLAVVSIDLDHFKRYNEKFGRPAGDEVLSSVGQILMRCVRAEDLACRYGSDQFVLVFPNSTLSDADGRAKQLRERLKDHQTEAGFEAILPTVSMGIAAYDETTDRIDLLLNFAKDAVRRAKGQGRNRIVVAHAAASSSFLHALNDSPNR